MNFARVLETVSGFLAEKGYQHALIGGVALAAYGFARTTLDLDFVLDAEAQEDVVGFLASRGYETTHRTSGYSSHVHPDPLWGRVDILYVRGETSREIFASCRASRGPGGLAVLLPKPEHLAAMKTLAMKNDPGRTFQEMADIRFLLQLPGVDRQEVKRYFDRHGLKERFDELEKDY
ncbi:MAG TPA: hypothetical protein VFE33_02660 [Thermoanaerobaculia bacterium]|nr:hypothetical protein [Thermoanaerobaculia bacterium]